ncbi:hypothetical protein BHM03_00056671 [Ensete ventricosum]|nr:hypothetical protein BHM03_00056671 [Ensete ventricosum]
MFHPCRLDCSSNQLKELPSSLGRCLDLSELKVLHFLMPPLYMFISLEISSIPSSIMGCSSLAEFYMGWNQFTIIFATRDRCTFSFRDFRSSFEPGEQINL